MLDDIADELVDRLDQIGDRLVVAACRGDVAPDEGPDAGELVDAGRDRDRRLGQSRIGISSRGAWRGRLS